MRVKLAFDQCAGRYINSGIDFKLTSKAFLLFENLDQTTWGKKLDDVRSAYGSLKEHLLRGIEYPDDISAADPLADDDEVCSTTSMRSF